MAKRRRKRNQHNDPALTHSQLQMLIPGGSVNKHRARRDEIEIETRAATEGGTAMIAGEYISTAVRKLMARGAVTLEEHTAVQNFIRDRDLAYASSTNALAAIQVDCNGDGTGGMERKVHHSLRFEHARAWLHSQMFRVAQAGILDDGDADIGRGFTAIGADMLPGYSKQEQLAAGQGCLVMVIRELAVIYGARNPDRSRIVVND
jgi:hypothetical protein